MIKASTNIVENQHQFTGFEAMQPPPSN